MKKSELKQLIRECYKEVIIENSNPFNSTKKTKFNPFNLTVVKGDEGSVDEGITVTDVGVDIAIYNMKQVINKLGKKSSDTYYKDALKQLPLFKGIFERGFFTTKNEPERGMFPGERTVNYEKHLNSWNEVEKNATEKEKKEAKDLLTVLKDNNGKPLAVNDDLRLTSSHGKDSIVLRCKISNVLKIFTFGIADSKLTYLVVIEATGTFKGVTTGKNIAADEDELTKIGNAIVSSVEDQGGRVMRDGYIVFPYNERGMGISGIN